MQKAQQVNVRLSEDAKHALNTLTDYYQVSQATVFEVLLSEEIRRTRLEPSNPLPRRWRWIRPRRPTIPPQSPAFTNNIPQIRKPSNGTPADA